MLVGRTMVPINPRVRNRPCRRRYPPAPMRLSNDEASRVHHAARRRGGDVAAGGSRAAGSWGTFFMAIPSAPLPRADLTPDRMRQGISRLGRCIAIIEAFDPQTIQTPHDTSKAEQLSASVDSALVQTFGDDTADYRRYLRAKNFSWPLNMARPTPIPEIQESLAKCRARSLALLHQAVSFLKQELELSGSGGATEKSDAPSARPSIGTNVFIGHGRSLVWRELKDFL